MENTDEERSNFFTSVRSFLSSITKSLEFLTNPAKGLLDILNPLSDNFFLKKLFNWFDNSNDNFIFKDLFSWLNPTSENFILKKLWDFLINMISYLNPFDDNFLGKKLVELIGDLLEYLFIPKEDHFSDLSNELYSKLGFVEQLKELYNTLFPDTSTQSISSPPNWTITYSGVTISIIDWTAFEEYRSYLHTIIIFILWASFLIKLYKRIPMIIYGYTDK